MSSFRAQEISPLPFSVGATYVPLSHICRDEMRSRDIGRLAAVWSLRNVVHWASVELGAASVPPGALPQPGA